MAALGCHSERSPTHQAPPSLPAGLAGAEAAIRDDLESHHQAVLEGLADTTLSTEGLARRFGDFGVSLYAHGYYAPAATVFGQAGELGPEHFSWPYYLGHALRRSGDMAAAAAAFGRALQNDEHSLPARLWLAEVEMSQERLEQAEAAFEAGLERAPQCAQAWTGLGRIALSRGRYARAEDLLRTALEYQPESPAARYALAMAVRGRGRISEAREELTRLQGEDHSLIITCFEDPLIREAKRRQTGSRSHEERAARARREGRLATALVELRAAVQANPNRFPARYDIAHMLFLLRRLDDSRAELESLLRDQPDYPAALALLARIKLEQGDAPAAGVLIDRAVAADPQSEDTHLVRADFLFSEGRNAEALLAYERAATIAPGLVPAVAGRTTVLFALGRVAEALGYLKAETETFPTRTRIALLRAHCLLAAGSSASLPTALELAGEAVAREPTIGAAETLALALGYDRRFAAAGEWQERALASMPAGPAWESERRRAESRLKAFRSGRRVEASRDREALASAMSTEPLNASVIGRGGPERPK